LACAGPFVDPHVVSTEVTRFAAVIVVGLGATLFMDVWGLFMNRAFRVPLANYCLVGRWICHMPDGRFTHASISAARSKAAECMVGWIVHYVVGVGYALLLVAIVPAGWVAQPTLLPAIAFGVASVVVPYFIMQPAFGLGIAASKAPQPNQARLRSLMAHTVFGLGLYLCAVGVSRSLPLQP
jgi:hypothetical protein